MSIAFDGHACFFFFFSRSFFFFLQMTPVPKKISRIYIFENLASTCTRSLTNMCDLLIQRMVRARGCTNSRSSEVLTQRGGMMK